VPGLQQGQDAEAKGDDRILTPPAGYFGWAFDRAPDCLGKRARRRTLRLWRLDRPGGPSYKCSWPRCKAAITAWVRSLTPRRARITLTWHFTVASAMRNAAPISLLLFP